MKKASLILYVFDLSNTNLKSIKSEIKSDFLKGKHVFFIGNKNDLKVDKKISDYFIENSFQVISANSIEDINKIKNNLNLFISKNIVSQDSSIMINENITYH